MCEPHLVVCGPGRPPHVPAAWRTADPLRLNMGPGRGDVRLRVGHLTRRLAGPVPPVFVDLLEVAAYVYAADQALPRGGTREFESGSRWRRRVRLEITVRQLDVWNRSDVREALTECLSFVLDDHTVEFGFRPFVNPPSLDTYLFDDVPAAETGDWEEVVLFSGGLDSLGGAVQEILQGEHKVVLVGHNPVSKVVSRQRELAVAIGNRVPNRLRPLHVPVEVNVRRHLGVQFTQRSRSFL